MNCYAGIDVGGTKIYAVIINEEGQILSRAKLKTGIDRDFATVFGKIRECYVKAAAKADVSEEQIVSVGLAVPSSIDDTQRIIKHAPNLGWINIEFGDILRDTFGKPAFIDNDVNMGTFGEYHLGAGKGYKSMYGMFVGTGLGGGYIANGEIVRGVNYTASEIGHMIIKMNGPKCNCGNRGCLEAFAAKAGMINYMKKRVDQKGYVTLLDEIEPNWRHSVGSSALRKALKRNDKLVRKALKRSANAIGLAAANLITITGVEAIVVGGGVVEELGDFFMPRIQKSIQEHIFAEGADGVALLQSTLGDDAVALGAAWFVRLPEKQSLLFT